MASAPLFEAAIALIDAIEATLDPSTGALDQEPHLTKLAPLYRRVRRIFARYFKRQGTAVVAALEPSILQLFDGVREAAAPIPPGIMDRISHMMPLTFAPLSFALTQEDQDAFEAAVKAAVARAGAALWSEWELSGTFPETPAVAYLQLHGLERLTGNLAATSVDVLRQRIAAAYQSGGTFSSIVAEIRAVFSEFSDSRAEMIAQTEMNSAYNFGRMATAAMAGMNEKRWDVDAGACDICLANRAAGWVGITATFPSGHLMPTAHPRCRCGVGFRLHRTWQDFEFQQPTVAN